MWRNRRRTLITAASIFFAVFFALLMTSLQNGSYDYLYKNAIESYSGYIQLQQENWWDEKTIDNTFEYSEDINALLMDDENVKATIQAIIEALSGLVGQSPFDCDQGIEIVDGQIGQLAMVRQMLIDIRDRAENEKNKEAA